MPVDLTALFFVSSLVSGIFVLLCNKFTFKKKPAILVGLYLLFIWYVTVSLFWTPGAVYAFQKLFYIATLILWPVLAGALIISQDRRRLNRFLCVLFLFSLFLVIESIIFFTKSGGVGFVTALGGRGAYLGLGRVIGLGTILTFWYLLFGSKFWKSHSMIIIVLILFLFTLFILGGKAPLIATIIAFFLPLIFAWRLDHKWNLKFKKSGFITMFFFIALGTVIFYLFKNDLLTKTLGRMLVLLNDDMGSSAGTRLGFYVNAASLCMEKPVLGYGIGSWPILTEGVDIRGYPHNIILEILVELGLAGLMIFVGFLGYGLKLLGSIRRTRDYPARLLILMLFINTLFNAMVSGDISDNRILFFMIGLMALTKIEGKNIA